MASNPFDDLDNTTSANPFDGLDHSVHQTGGFVDPSTLQSTDVKQGSAPDLGTFSDDIHNLNAGVAPLVDTANDGILNKAAWALPDAAYEAGQYGLGAIPVAANVVDRLVAKTGLSHVLSMGGHDFAPANMALDMVNSLDPNVLGVGEAAQGAKAGAAEMDAAHQALLDARNARYQEIANTQGADGVIAALKEEGVDPKDIDEAAIRKGISAGGKIVTEPASPEPAAVPAATPDAIQSGDEGATINPSKVDDSALVTANDAHDAAAAKYAEVRAKGIGLTPNTPEYKDWLEELRPAQQEASAAYDNLVAEHAKVEADETAVSTSTEPVQESVANLPALVAQHPDNLPYAPSSGSAAVPATQDTTVDPSVPATTDAGSGGGQPPVVPTRDLAVSDSPQPEGEGETNRASSNGTQDNINYNKHATEEDVDDLLRRIKSSGMYQGTDWDEHAAKAKALYLKYGMAHIIRHDPALSEASEYSLAKSMAMVDSGNELKSALEDYRDNGATDAKADNIRRLGVVAGAAKESVSNVRGLGGRLLNQMKMIAGSSAESRAAFDRMMNGAGVADGHALAQTMLKHLDNPSVLPDIAAASLKPYWEDYAMKLWYNGALSSPKTWVMTALDNSQMLFMDLAAHSAAPSVSLPETMARWAGATQAVRDMAGALVRPGGSLGRSEAAARKIVDAFNEGHPSTGMSGHAPVGADFGAAASDLAAKLPASLQPIGHKIAAGVGKLDTLTSVGPKTIAAVDEMFRGMASNMEISGLSVRNALAEGLKPGTPEFKARVADLRLNPTKKMVDAANDKAALTQYAEKFGANSFTGKLQDMAGRKPNMNWADRTRRVAVLSVIPFPRVEMNILRNMVRNSPLGFASPTMQKAIKAGGVEREVALAKMALGTTLLGYVTAKAANGDITGTGSANYRLRQNMPPGWLPNSIRINGVYHTMGNTSLATTAGVMATLYEEFHSGMRDTKSYAGAMSQAISGFLGSMEESSWLGQTAETLQALEPGPDGDVARRRLIPNKAASVLPALATGVNQSFVDPAVRDLKADTMGGRVENAIESRIPGLSQNLPQQHDIYGNPLTRQRNFFTGSNASPEGTDPVQQEFARLTERTGKPTLTESPSKFKFGGQKVELTPAQHEELIAKTGQYLDAMATPLISSKEYANIPDEVKQKIIHNMASGAQNRAKAEILHPQNQEVNPFDGL